MIAYIADTAHYNVVLSRVARVEHTLQIGMKGGGKRNFEAGILTDDLALVDAAADHFDSVWTGAHCKTCRRKDFCQDRIR